MERILQFMEYHHLLFGGWWSPLFTDLWYSEKWSGLCMIRAELEPDLNARYLPWIVLSLSTDCLRQSCWVGYSLPLLSISYILGNSPVWGRGESFAIFMMRLGNPFIKKNLSSVHCHCKQASKHFINIKLWVLSPILQMCKLRPGRLCH